MKGKDIIEFTKESKLEEIEVMVTVSINNECNAREIENIGIETGGLTVFLDIGNIHDCKKEGLNEPKCQLNSCASPFSDNCDGCYWFQ